MPLLVDVLFVFAVCFIVIFYGAVQCFASTLITADLHIYVYMYMYMLVVGASFIAPKSEQHLLSTFHFIVSCAYRSRCFWPKHFCVCFALSLSFTFVNTLCSVSLGIIGYYVRLISIICLS